MANLTCPPHCTPPHETDTVRTAFHLYDIGLNVGPQPYKPGPQLKSFPWKKLQYTRLPRDHSVYGLHRLFAGRCNIGVIRGVASRNLFTIRCFSDHTLNRILEDLQSRNIVRWATRQPAVGGGEIWFLCSDGEVEDLFVPDLLPFEVLGTGYILCPPFQVDSDNPVQWLVRESDEPPTVTPSQMDWLFYENGTRIRYRTGEPVALNLAASRLQRQQPLQAVRQQRAEALLAYAQYHAWPGKAGTTERDVFHALIQRMKTNSSERGGVFRASERELAELSHRGRKAVHRALGRLKSKRLVLYAGPDDKARANRYRFPDRIISAGMSDRGDAYSSTFNGVDSTYSPLAAVSFSSYSPLADILEPAALGRNALTVYDTLMAVGFPLTMPSIAVRSGLSLNKVRTAIQKLTRFGMVEHKGKRVGYAAVPKTIKEIADIAKEAGTDGNSAKRKAKHLEERSLHAAHSVLLARQQQDEANLPLEMQPPRDWNCSSCGNQVSSRYGSLPEVCPHCGQTKPTWKRLPRPRKLRASAT